MAFSATKTGETVFGDKRVTYGTWDGGGETGGNINTGLHHCEHISLTAKGGAIVADAPTVDETLPCDGSAVTIIVTSDTDGYWMAFGA
jgi:hypothetical protein